MIDFYETAVRQKKNFVIWGVGKYMMDSVHRINPDITISHLCDSNPNLWGKEYDINNKKVKCIEPDKLSEKDLVMIACQSVDGYRSITEYLKTKGINYCHINDAIQAYIDEYEQNEISKYDEIMCKVEEPGNPDIIKCFINVSVPIDFCNLQCQYCYVGQHNDFFPKKVIYHSVDFIRRALSRKRIGGTAFINFCGTGETLLCKEITGVIHELIKEGHYCSIITNAICDNAIDLLLKDDCEKLFFKCSFHYLELKRKNLLEKFANNVRKMLNAGASVSVELVPHDELIPYIDEIKDFSIKQFGALPHLTVARDETTEEMDILSDLNREQYIDTWKTFDSCMFDFKINNMTKPNHYCIAGKGTFLMNLDNGGAIQCPGNCGLKNIYKEIYLPIDNEEIGENCKCKYCRNSHAYFTMGMVKEIECISYLDIRDRECIDKRHWINGKMRKIMQQRICDNLGDN